MVTVNYEPHTRTPRVNGIHHTFPHRPQLCRQDLFLIIDFDIPRLCRPLYAGLWLIITMFSKKQEQSRTAPSSQRSNESVRTAPRTQLHRNHRVLGVIFPGPRVPRGTRARRPCAHCVKEALSMNRSGRGAHEGADSHAHIPPEGSENHSSGRSAYGSPLLIPSECGSSNHASGRGTGRPCRPSIDPTFPSKKLLQAQRPELQSIAGNMGQYLGHIN